METKLENWTRILIRENNCVSRPESSPVAWFGSGNIDCLI